MVQAIDDDRPPRFRPGMSSGGTGEAYLEGGGAVGVAAIAGRQPRVPPHDLDAEESLLGAMLLSGDAVVAAIETCSAGDFYKPAHGHIFSAVASLFEAGEPVDAVTVADELRRRGLIDQIGEPTVLVSLQANTPSLANAGHYARIVEEHALLRRLIGVAGELAEMGYAVPDDVTAAIDEAERLVFDLSERRTADSVESLRNLIGPSLDRIEELSHRSSRITGVATGYSELDDVLAGLQPASLTIVGARPAMGKALALDTPIPTPNGWASMGNLRVGDEVYDDAGHPCRVTYRSPVFTGRPCFLLRFDDGSSLVADAEHRWFAYDFPAWKSHRAQTLLLGRVDAVDSRFARDQSARRRLPGVVTTKEMLDAGVRRPDGRPNWYFPLAQALECPTLELPVDPYVLGCWLGDGASASAEVTFGDRDAAHFAAELEQRGYRVSRPSRLQWATPPVGGSAACQSYRGPSRVLARELQAAGLLHDVTKLIPDPYLRASVKQRLELLQGLLDTAGTVTSRNGSVELCLENGALLEQAWELVCSLGDRPRPIRKRRLPLREGGWVTARCFRWTPRDPVFRMPRKAELLAATTSARRDGRHTRRALVAIEPVASVPVRCISVDSPSHLFLAGRAMNPTHNTSLALGMLAHVGTVLRRPALLFSLEMGHLELTQRLLASEARVDAQRMRTGHLHDSDWGKVGAAVSRLSESTIFIDENPHLTVMDIRARARRLKKSEGDLGLVVVDYLQLMTGRGRAENRQVEVSEISRGLKILARELECPVVALSQLSRNLEARQDKRPMLSDLRESGCMPASTRLLRADTGEEVTLGELVLTQEQPLVWSLDDQTWKLAPRRLVKAFPSGRKLVFRLRLRSGFEVEATANHKFRTVEGWRRLDEIAVGEHIAVPRRIGVPSSPRGGWPDDELVLLAHLLGDGSVGPTGVRYATADPDNKRVVEDTARRLFGIEVAGHLRRDTWLLSFPAHQHPARGRHHPVRNWLEPHGLWGIRSHDKFIPEPVLGMGDRELALFLRHLWATDGSITLRPDGDRGLLLRVSYATPSRRLADGVKRALLRLGVRSRVSPDRKAADRIYWNVHVTGTPDLMTFLTRVGCHGARGRVVGRALELLATSVPNPDLAEIARDGRPSGPAGSDVSWDEVIEIVAVGEQPTFDATVEGTHNFVANGVIAHNSLEQDADVVLFIFREELYDPETPIDRRGLAEIIVAKHRNGPTGSAHLVFLGQYARFDNLQQV